MLTYTKSAKEGGIDKSVLDKGGRLKQKRLKMGSSSRGTKVNPYFFILFAYLLICKFADH
ncbi:hypothetical protein DQ356_06435 [Chryseobacterium lacus]|uniref:Uncharacterized protein n=1 Tax=Chryseobacterium lacus TaxID=2058346 RepID=A0A368N0A0_9FLAO|nr:hypothetical protein DQ356_06435 [Chryseobacterium lacus]